LNVPGKAASQPSGEPVVQRFEAFNAHTLTLAAIGLTDKRGLRFCLILDNAPPVFYCGSMAETETPVMEPGVVETTEEKDKSELEPGYLVICWNDPVNYMQYVTHVFQKVFGWPRQKAEFHMLQVHEQGKSVLARESMEKAEHYVHQLQKYTLHATMEPDA